MSVTPDYPIPIPTPYQSPYYGGSTSVAPGTVGPPVSGGTTLGATSGTGNADEMWNQGWNSGFNSGGSPYSGSDPNYSAGYNTGWQEYLTRNPAPTGNPNPNPNPTPAPTGSDTNTLTAELDAIFNPIFGALQGQENTLNQNYAPVEGQIQSQGDLSLASLGSERDTGSAQLVQQETDLGGRRDDALTSATRLYDELSRGGQQRFGGASSAGEAYGALTAVEQQRRQGTIQGAFETGMQKVGQFKADLEARYALAKKDVELQVNEAKESARAQFRDALQAIQTAKATVQSEKATATMNTLNDYRNKVYTIQANALSFVQTLALNHEATLSQVDAYTQKVMQSISGGSQALSANPLTNYQASTNLGVSSGANTGGGTQYTGSIKKNYNPDDPTTWGNA
jgi:hypothetical protein